LREELVDLARTLNIEKRVTFAGLVRDTAGLLKQSDIFVLSSAYEGMPNCLLEAMAMGLGVISTDCSPSIREIIQDERDGLIVPPSDVEALAYAMDRLLSDDEERARYGRRALEVRERFSLEKIMPMWEEVLEKVCPQAWGARA
jgi:glycosyltransferase involved in cell wall biosynthesis